VAANPACQQTTFGKEYILTATAMATENPENWYLKKHENQEVFGPVRFEKILEWAQSAQVNPQDLISNDKEVWTRPPMIPQLDMDWLVELGANLLYGPTTSGTLIEFAKSGEISAETRVINCVDGKSHLLREADFYREDTAASSQEGAGATHPVIQQPLKGGIRANLQKRVRELEQALLEKQRLLNAAREKIKRLEAKIRDLEARVREAGGPANP
jgi:hypothetical protein